MSHGKRASGAMFALASFSLVSAQPSNTETFFTGLGNHHYKVSTNSPLAQRYFDQGLAFVYGFNHDEAVKSFKAAAAADPNCAMAWWGIALADGPHINNPSVAPDREREAIDALIKASHLRSSEKEARLIRAAQVRFSSKGAAERGKCDKNYAAAMARVWRQYPGDPDIGALSSTVGSEAWNSRDLKSRPH